MKFENIAVGDEVLIPKFIVTGYRDYHTFYIKLKVTKITKTQFSVSDRRFKKDNGREIGSDRYHGAEREGEIKTRWNILSFKDQTEEYNLFKSKVNAVNKINSIKDSIYRKEVDVKTSLEILEDIASKLSNIKKAMEIAEELKKPI